MPPADPLHEMFVLIETLRPVDEHGLTTTDIQNSTPVCDNVKRSVQTGKNT